MALSAKEFAEKIPGAVVRDLGFGLAVITFIDKTLAEMAFKVVEYISNTPGLLVYDIPVMCQGTNKEGKRNEGIRRRGEAFFVSPTCGVDAYKFGGKSSVGHVMNPCMQELLDAINLMVPNEKFHAMFCVNYRDTEDQLGWHSDKDVGDEEVGVFAMSIGQSRCFKVRGTGSTAIKLEEFHTKHGEALIMYGKDFQKLTQHAVTSLKVRPNNPPFVTGIRGRFSLTFRRHIEKPTNKNTKKDAIHKIDKQDLKNGNTYKSTTESSTKKAKHF